MKKRPSLRVETGEYIDAVRKAFGTSCAYCRIELSVDTHVEHLVAMNRVRAGLHVAGNVVLSCKRCNNAKRGDDQRRCATPGNSGWDNFLNHDATHCAADCVACSTWKERLGSSVDVPAFLTERRDVIQTFRHGFDADAIGSHAVELAKSLESLYRRWQEEADVATKKFTQDALSQLSL